MSDQKTSDLSSTGHERFESDIPSRFADAQARGDCPRIVDYMREVPAGCDPNQRRYVLMELVKEDVEQRLRNRTPHLARIEDYLADWPELREDHRALMELIEFETVIRLEIGGRVTPEDLEKRFPKIERSQLSQLLNRVTRTHVTSPINVARFTPIRELGRGRFGVVWLCHDVEMDRPVAVKVLFKPDGHVQSVNEAQRAGPLQHDHIVAVHDIGRTENGGSFIVYAFINGTDLKRLLEEHAPLDPHKAVDLVIAVADALEYAHKQELVHRDIKPANILVERSTGKAFLTDFGLAASEDDFGRGSTFVGTPAYMSPEQARGEADKVDHRTDIFSLAIVFMELLIGRRPWHNTSDTEALLKEIASTEPRPLRHFNPNLPEELDAICCKATKKSRDDRYSTAGDFAAALRRWVENSRRVQPGFSAVTQTADAAKHNALLVLGGLSRPEPPEPDTETKMIPAGHALPFLAELCIQNKLAIVVGPGLSIANGMSFRDRFLQKLMELTNKQDPAFDDWPGLAGVYVSRLGIAPAEAMAAKHKLISAAIDVLDAHEAARNAGEYGDILPRLANLPTRSFYTTSWDRALERCLKQSGLPPVDVFDNRFVQPPSGSVRHLTYLHGRLDGPLEQVIITDVEHRRLRSVAAAVYERLVAELRTGTAFLCIGCSFIELKKAEYLREAQNDSCPDQIYALSTPLHPGEAHSLSEWNHVKLISLDCAPSQTEEALERFLDSLARLVARQHAEYTPPVATLPSPSPQAQADSEYLRLTNSVQGRLRIEGYESPGDRFRNLPADDLPRPLLPPTHHLLNRVYVERRGEAYVQGPSLDEWVKTRLCQGGFTGLLGIGGIGKTYLALRIAWEFHKQKDWDVVWVSLHERGVEQDLDVLARACGLTFVDGLQTGEKLEALDWLFERFAAGGRRVLVVLDNAEFFPNLSLFLRALMRTHVLVTSRTEECRELVTYRTVRPMTSDESMELCRQLLAELDDGRVPQALSPDDQTDLQELCRALGGHPMGVRMAIAGYLRMSTLDRPARRPFARVLESIQKKGADALPALSDPDSGLAGERIHQSVSSTFDWLFRQLPQFAPDYGRHAQLLLPLIAVFGASSVTPEILRNALRMLAKGCKDRAGGTPPPPPGAEVTTKDGFDEEDLRILSEVGDYRFGSILGRLTCDGIQVPPHDTVFDDRKFLEKLRSSISLTIEEKLRVISAVPTLSQFQIDELGRILDNESSAFAALSPKHLKQLKQLEEKLANDWNALLAGEITLNDSLEPPPPTHTAQTDQRPYSDEQASQSTKIGADDSTTSDLAARSLMELAASGEVLSWIRKLEELNDPLALNAAIKELNRVALIEVETEPLAIRIHPLIREYAFAERRRATPVIAPGLDALTSPLTIDGPSLFAIFACGLGVIERAAEHVESLMDLARLIKERCPSLAAPACSALWHMFYELYFKQRNWPKAREVLTAGVEMAAAQDLREWHGRFLCKLGEVLDRMEEPDGLGLIRQGLELLGDAKNAEFVSDAAWARAYLHRASKNEDAQAQVQAIAEEWRQVKSDRRTVKNSALGSSIEGYWASYIDRGPMASQLSLSSSSSSFLTNCVLDLSEWLNSFCEDRLEASLVDHARDLATLALKRQHRGASQNDAITPKDAINLECALFAANDLCDPKPIDELDRFFKEQLAAAKAAGIRGFAVQSEAFYRKWVRAVMDGNWQAAVDLAERYVETQSVVSQHRSDLEILRPRILLVATKLATGASDPVASELIGAELNAIEKRFKDGGCNELLGWLLLARSLWHVQPDQPDRPAATQCLVLARRAFELYTLDTADLPEPVERLHQRAVELINRGRPKYETRRKQLTEPETIPPDFRPWLIDRRCPLPRYVRCRRDGRKMRLVESGLQPGPFDRDTWHYPFYIDEQPVSAAELTEFARDTGRTLVIEGEPSGAVAVFDHQLAEAYATWSGKRLPNLHEWYAATWQLAAGQKPEQWLDAATARNRILERIERAINDSMIPLENRLPVHEFVLSEAEKRAILEYHWDGRWFTDSPLLSGLLHDKVVSRVAKHLPQLSADECLNWATGLACAVSYLDVERIGMIAVVPWLSESQMRKTGELFNEEKHKFLQVDPAEYDGLLGLCRVRQAEFVRVLLAEHSGIDDSLEPAQVFHASGITPHPSIVAALSAAPAYAVSVSPAELHSAWSGMTGQPDGQPRDTLWGDPLTQAMWLKGDLLPAGKAGNWNIGIRCVLPLFTARDLDLVEPIE